MAPAARRRSTNRSAGRKKKLQQRLTDSHRERVAAAGGELLGAAFKLLGELVAESPPSPPPSALVASLRDGLASCVDEDEEGKPRLTVTLPDHGALEGLAQTLARLLVAGQPSAD